MSRPRTLAALLALACLGMLAAPAQATFPGGNGRIAFSWHVGGERFEEGPSPRLVGVVSVRPDGSGRRLVARRGTLPRYSPDGRRIAFLRSHRLWVARAGGGRARQLTPSHWLVGSHQWSPRGTRLGFVRDFRRAEGSALYTVEPDGSGLRRLMKARQDIALFPGAWSPDGKAIVYEQHSLRPLVRVIRAGRPTTLVRASGRPSWSRDGLIAYTTFGPGEGGGQVCIRRPAAMGPDRCISFPDASVFGQAWSPDGDRLLLLHQGQGPGEVLTASVDGTVLTRAQRPNVFPILSPDGGRFAFSEMRFRDGLAFQDLFVTRLDGSGERRLVRGGQATQPDWQPLRR